LFIGLERLWVHGLGMKFVLAHFALVCATALSGGEAVADRLVASRWLDFNEAKVRLVASSQFTSGHGKPGTRGRAGLEIRLKDGYKTYWRSVGDSGVPPIFDFSRSTGIGIGNVEVRFPFPVVFDDGAGGKAWGYRHAVYLPIEVEIREKPYLLRLNLDFAVCGTMCIPLSGQLELDPGKALPLGPAEKEALRHAAGVIPVRIASETSPRANVKRLSPLDPPRWEIHLPYEGGHGDFSAFFEASGFLDLVSVQPEGAGVLRLMIKGQPTPGSGGKFGPVTMTYGRVGNAFEQLLVLDDAPLAGP
jgi:DsbC/DsbD-like thiol-disulfide interchange protein